ncbi:MULTISPECIES: acyl-CoA dehydrogenase family protein [Streptomyces]|uniref:Acyl-CoA dehydrogenase family protein n=1 Tax=Streptomyces doudnae TaxID=3075536 RepID=A0ABD5EVG0_9ACTN|nr:MULTISPECIES: acyl-CoA dehydrogenase family protein [unclassified Streptomyces]MDT0438643.1 acyl-CoA dehydrogenase family protein [Streptomyces sp. DSM 41981]MYQ69069.1 acyl-CoA dehydrogenase [Streptomyces sp. SID4950]SCE51139.1 acyl-CoA dehydrogenase [Streptomyces sp. SolWspMP-5a-2]
MNNSDSERELVVRTVQDILDARPVTTDEGRRERWDADLWALLADSDMTAVGIAETHGGAGGAFGDAAAIVSCLAAAGAAVPLAEHLLVVAPALAGTSLAPSDLMAPVTFARGGQAVADGEGYYRLNGELPDVAWGDVASRAAVLVQVGTTGALVLAETHGHVVKRTANLADEPRATLAFDDVRLPGVPLTAQQVEAIDARMALARAVQLTGALHQVFDWTCEYARERTQFGRPLSDFPTVRTDLVRMAGEVAAATALTEAAVEAAPHNWDILPAAAAKIRAGAAVEVVARSAHQIHGAIGFTREHRLHHLTRRLWAWREEAGTERHWSQVLGGHLRPKHQALWPQLVDAV